VRVRVLVCVVHACGSLGVCPHARGRADTRFPLLCYMFLRNFFLVGKMS